MKKVSFGMLIMSLMVGSSTLFAFEVRSGPKIIQTYDVNDDYVIFSGDAELKSDVKGNLYVIGQNINFTGTVENDLYVVAEKCFLNGTVEDNVYVAAENIYLAGQSYGDIKLAGEKIFIDSTAYIRGDVSLAGDKITVNGHIQGNVEIHGKTFILNGTIDGNLITYVDVYQMSEMAYVSGIVEKHEPEHENCSVKSRSHFIKRNLLFHGSAINFFLFSLICAAIWYALFPESFKGSGSLIKNKPLKMGLWGFLCLILLPLFGLISMIFIVSIPLSLLFLFFFGVTLFLGQFPVAVWIGNLLTHKIPGYQKGMLPAATGLAVLHIFLNIPVLTIFFLILWIFVGFGSIWYWMLKRQKAKMIISPNKTI